MTLPQIDQRLTLFSEYLKYRVDSVFIRGRLASYIYETYKATGVLLYEKEWAKLMSFDLWLVNNGYSELTVCAFMDDYPKILTVEEYKTLKQILFN